MGGGLLKPIPGVGGPAGRATAAILTGGLSEIARTGVLGTGAEQASRSGGDFMGSLLFSPASGLAAGSAGLIGAGGIGAGGMGAAAPAASSTAAVLPAGTLGPVTPSVGYGGLSSGGLTDVAGGGGGFLEGANKYAFPVLAGSTLVGTAAQVFRQPPPPLMGNPSSLNLSGGGGGSFQPTALAQSNQLAQLIAQRRQRPLGTFVG